MYESTESRLSPNKLYATHRSIRRSSNFSYQLSRLTESCRSTQLRKERHTVLLETKRNPKRPIEKPSRPKTNIGDQREEIEFLTN